MDNDAVETILAENAVAASLWRGTPFQSRRSAFVNFAQALRHNRDSTARTFSTEMGKPIREARSEVEKAAELADYCAGLADNCAKPVGQVLRGGTIHAETRALPVGTILCITTANYPLWQPLRSILPALWSGNAVVLRHSRFVQQSATLLERLFPEAGFPENLVRLLQVPHSAVRGLLRHPKIHGLAYTGSDTLGRKLAAECGKLMKPGTFMLAGNDACLVFGDADLRDAAETCVASRLQNSGQACIAAQRILLHRSIAEPFTQHLVTLAASWKSGDPLDEQTKIGPLISTRHRQTVAQQVAQALQYGGTVIYEGDCTDDPAFFPITIIDRNAPGSPLWDTEVFGPVFGLSVFDDEDAMIDAANNTTYPLGVTLFSRRTEYCRRLAAERLKAPMVAVNSILQSHPEIPFNGGVGNGLGSELGSRGFAAFTRPHTSFIPT